MSNIAIKVENLSKRYRIGLKEELPDTLIETVAAWIKAPLSNLRQLRQLSHFSDNGHDPDDVIWALKDVSFEVKQGEVVGIIGRNGAGKSTLLKIISRITEPTAGRVILHGRVSSLLEVGTGFHAELTGRENVYLNGTILGMRKAEIDRKFDEIIDFSGVEKFIDTPVKRYSSGMKVRLAFAVAAHLEPEILLVDEVLAVGDAAFQKKCLGKMGDVAREGRTVLFVSHNMPAITRLCPRAILLDGGRLIQDGKATEVISTYMIRVNAASGSRKWSQRDVPGTDELRVTSVKLLRENGSPTSVVDVIEPVKLQIGYFVGKQNLRFRCEALFFTQGVCAFTSIEPFERIHEYVGMYYSTLNIPANLFAEGEYTVWISIYTSKGIKVRLTLVRDAISFQVFDGMNGHSARGDYAHENLAGVIRPLLEWELSFEGS